MDDSRLGAGRRMVTRYMGKRLCKSCRKLDLDAAFQKKSLTSRGTPVRRSGIVVGPADNSCPLCELLIKTYGLRVRDRPARHDLRSFSSGFASLGLLGSINTVMLALSVRYGPFLVPQVKGAETVRILESAVSYKVLKEWLIYCRDRHTKVCALAHGQSPVSSISSFKVIECRTRQVILWSGQPFATLSYVWGANSTAPPFSDVLPDELPRTIQDAIVVAAELGLGYIWVDRYCINQQVEEEVADHVSKMDLIYQISEVTIIGAAGQGADHGLPGVGRSRDLPQPSAKVGKHFLVSSMTDPAPAVKRSKWWTRGWTYQEGVMSRRRLVFTESQVYFECGGMYCYEAHNPDLASLHTNDGQRFRHHFRGGSRLGIFPTQLSQSPWQVVERITEYSQRTLGNASDVLNALRGVLRAFESSRLRPRHFFGVPVLPTPPRPRERVYDPRNEAPMLYGSHPWSTTDGFCAGLSWQVQRPMERRPGFPSWSWAGWTTPVEKESAAAAERAWEWTCPIRWAFDQAEWQTFLRDTDLQLGVRLRDGQTRAWEELSKDHDDLELSVQSPCVLDVSARVTPVHVRRCEEGTCYAEVQAADGRFLEWRFVTPPLSWQRHRCRVWASTWPGTSKCHAVFTSWWSSR